MHFAGMLDHSLSLLSMFRKSAVRLGQLHKAAQSSDLW